MVFAQVRDQRLDGRMRPNVRSNFLTVPDSVYQLVEKFTSGERTYKRADYNETQLRVEFVNPLFEALGWDVRDNTQVSHEIRVLIEGKPKRPDYGFRIGATTHFYLETKKPSLNLKDDPSPAYQLRRYGWSGNLPISILSDFEEFIIYDCRLQPHRYEPASKARLNYYRYPDYVDDWDKLYGLFSREAVADGALRKWIEDEKPRGALGVDQAFLREMEAWRESLAKDMALHNRHLNQRELNHVVQRTIDRIVFLRIAEDRNIESYGRLRSIAGEGKQVYQELKILFNEADDKYNSGLFHFDAADKRGSNPDQLSLNIHLSNPPLRDLIDNLYYPNSPYEFSVLPADILGQVYERFLGKVIELTDTGAAKIEEKPEVRKAGGVYYTPTYIVNYIVQNTVGKLLEGKTPDQAAKLRILDPACGSGSFLTGAYQYLLDWHLNYYREHPTSYRNNRRETPTGMILTTAHKRDILRNNIYGVDLDQNAVEVSKLSLLLKMLENEDESAATGRQTIMFAAGGRILPDLSDNIKWGNSLIGSDFYSGKQMDLFDDEQVLKVKPFDWDSNSTGFGDIMANGGFDAVIGNPPYGASLTKEERAYLTKKYKIGTTDTAALMMMAANSLCNESGINTFIVPKPFLFASNWKKTRSALLQNLVFVVDVGKVWKEVKLEQTIYQIAKSVERPFYRNFVRDDQMFLEQGLVQKQDCQQFGFYINRITNDEIALAKRLTENNDTLGRHVKNIRGGMLQGYIDKDGTIGKFVVGGKQVNGYRIVGHRGTITNPEHLTDNALINEDSILVQNIVAHIMNPVDHIKIIGTIPDEQIAMNCVILDTVNQLTNVSRMSRHYLLGLLHSDLINWYVYRFIFGKAIRTMHFDKPVTNRIPIRTIDFDNPADVAMHDNMVELVERMLDLHKQVGLTVVQRGMIEAQIEATDREIDALVYQLYDLTDDEVRVVEGG